MTPGEITSLSSRAMRFRLADVSTEALGELWAASGRELTATYLPSTVVAYAQLQQAVLDELTARDPNGVRRWLGDQPYRRGLRGYLQDQQRLLTGGCQPASIWASNIQRCFSSTCSNWIKRSPGRAQGSGSGRRTGSTGRLARRRSSTGAGAGGAGPRQRQ